jgi:uncharacterized protein (DUF2249 family)
MLINSNTKIAALIKHHPGALEAIVELSPDFKKLRNPVIRKLMAGRTSIAMASKIGGCKPEDFFEKLKGLGFETDNNPSPAGESDLPQKSLQQFVKDIEATRIVPLDVREMLSSGNDPLKLIQQTVKDLSAGQVLKVINTFEPTPLIALLKKQGFEAFVDTINEDLTETYFYRADTNGHAPVEVPVSATGGNNDWDELIDQFKDDLEQIDVRHLEMPGPMMTILETLEKLQPGKALYVHHKRIPVFLLTELRDRDFDYRIHEVSDSEVFLLIFRH